MGGGGGGGAGGGGGCAVRILSGIDASFFSRFTSEDSTQKRMKNLKLNDGEALYNFCLGCLIISSYGEPFHKKKIENRDDGTAMLKTWKATSWRGGLHATVRGH